LWQTFEPMNAEEKRLEEHRGKLADWKQWGNYIAERAWGTVREDYSATGAAWEYFPFEHAVSRTFRWNEDGIAGLCDRQQRICFAIALWNEKDAILKERLYGLNGNQGNHGEDVKEYFFYLDNTPTTSYSKFLYKYPQQAFPYKQLLEEAQRRSRNDAEFELLDTGIFDDNRYFDVFVEYAKLAPEDIFIKITVFNRAAEAAPLRVLPTVWFRNTWTWFKNAKKPRLESLESVESNDGFAAIKLNDPILGEYFLHAANAPELLFCENETNLEKLYNVENTSKFAKDGINDFVVNADGNAVNKSNVGTKAAAHYKFNIAAGDAAVVYLRFCKNQLLELERNSFLRYAEKIIAQRQREADEFYSEIIRSNHSADAQNVMRQAFAGMLWSRQFYHYEVKKWLDGDETQPPPPAERRKGRNRDWQHIYNADVISMPDKWEYPWYAAWDLAFHTISLALVDSDFAKRQLILMLREWYMHPNGQIPAYEWAFSDVNPPVHAWAALRVYQIERKRRKGEGDVTFLEKIFHKLLLNFTWWVNRKDPQGNNVFAGGFLGMDNIGVFDRNMKLPGGAELEQSDGTSWMAMYCLNMMAIALELARKDCAYEDVASKFFEHFVYISDALNNIGTSDIELWSEEDGFFYDVLNFSDGKQLKLRVRSMVGLIPLLAVENIEPDLLEGLPDFRRRIEWFRTHRPDLTNKIACMQEPGEGNRRIMAIVGEEKLRRVLRVMLDETEFLSDYGIRSLSKYHEQNPYSLQIDGEIHSVTYEPAESRTGLFGGNSNWRGPIWFPVNYLLIESLQKFNYYYGDRFKIELPIGSGQELTLWEVAQRLERRLARIFLKNAEGKRPVYGATEKFQVDPHWRDYVLFFEYFHGDNGAGLGASHQTGWTGLIAKILQQMGEYGTTV
jgi:hypothetical protein